MKICIIFCIVLGIVTLNLALGTCRTVPSGDNSTLRFIHIIFRHGKRSPITFFPDDPNNNFWADGLGQLTKAGKQDSYELGKWFRQRYSAFLSDYINDNETYIQSTEKDRTIETAQLFAAGLYPPKNTEVWSPELGSMWQPFPLRTVPKYMDPFVDDYTLYYCPRFLQLFKLVENTPDGKRVYDQDKTLIDLLQYKSGVNTSDEVIGFLDTADTISVEVKTNLTPPIWLNSNDVERVNELINYFTFYYIKTKELIQLNGGNLIYTIMNRMLDTINTPTKSKVHVYSAHDYTIIFLLSAMKMFNFIMPPFSSAVIIELHDINSEYFLKVLYRNHSNCNPYILHFPSCPDLCPWQQAWDAIQDNFVVNLTTSCAPLTSGQLISMQAAYNTMFP